MFRRFIENNYRRAVRKTVSKLSGIPEHIIPLDRLPKDDKEFEELITTTNDLARLTWLNK